MNWPDAPLSNAVYRSAAHSGAPGGAGISGTPGLWPQHDAAPRGTNGRDLIIAPQRIHEVVNVPRAEITGDPQIAQSVVNQHEACVCVAVKFGQCIFQAFAFENDSASLPGQRVFYV